MCNSRVDILSSNDNSNNSHLLNDVDVQHDDVLLSLRLHPYVYQSKSCGFKNVLCSENCVTFSFCNSSCGFIFDFPFSWCCWLLSLLIFFSNLILLDCGCARQYDYFRQSQPSSHLFLKRFIFNMKDITTTGSSASSSQILLNASLAHSSRPPP